MNELRVKTLPTHEDYDAVCKALEKVSAMAEYIDRENKYAEMCQRILQIQNAMVDKVVCVSPLAFLALLIVCLQSLLSGRRELVTEGAFQQIKEEQDKKTLIPLQFFLFNDILLLTSIKR